MTAAPLPEALRAPIITLDEGKRWLEALAAAGLDFHLEDDPEDIENIRTGERIFAAEDVPLIRDRQRALYALDWGEIECPIGYLLSLEAAREGQG